MVKVEDDRGRLRLRFSFEGKRYSIVLGVENTKANLKLAQAKAGGVEADIIFKRFDAESLEKYKWA
ncbi:MAG: Arm DNA-binding domain-containing protein [Brasilonema sp.]